MSDLVLASRNAKKVAELADILDGLGVRVVPVSEFPDAPDPEETEDTFAGNAALKAEAVRDAVGLPAIADDSGLVVDALDGMPGVHSARFAALYADETERAELPDGSADERNNALLLRRMEGVPDERRAARYVCVIALAAPDRETVFFEGSCEGRLLRAPRGTGGFGYDPLVESVDLERSFAEAAPEEKARVSHRGAALRAFADALRDGRVAVP